MRSSLLTPTAVISRLSSCRLLRHIFRTNSSSPILHLYNTCNAAHQKDHQFTCSYHAIFNEVNEVSPDDKDFASLLPKDKSANPKERSSSTVMTLPSMIKLSFHVPSLPSSIWCQSLSYLTTFERIRCAPG
jgi:hypothetical protein